MEKTKHSSAQKFVDDLLTEGAKVKCDDSFERFNAQYDVPPFFDEDLFKKGQAFFYENIFGLFFSKLLGLLAVLSVPSILRILIHTNKSSSEISAYRRYMATVFHMMAWYDSDFKPGSRLWRSIADVRKKHNSASKSGCSVGLTGITQKDMALTQFGFMGLALARSNMIGVHHASEEDWKAFIHVWRVVAYLLGTEDRFNLCGGTVQETRDICNLLLEQVYQPNIENKDRDFILMSNYLLTGFWSMIPLLLVNSVLCYLHVIVQCNNNNAKIRPTYMKLNFAQNFNFYLILNTMYLMRRNWFRIYQNYVQIISLWLMRVFPFLAYYQFGIHNAHVSILDDKYR